MNFLPFTELDIITEATKYQLRIMHS